MDDDQVHIGSIFDDKYAQKLDDDDVVFVSDDEYAQELQLQEALMASVIPRNITINRRSLSSSSLPSSSKAVQVSLDCKKIKFANKETGESSRIICEICAETKDNEQMFLNKLCGHSFCSECVIKQVATKVQENIAGVACPGLDCKSVLNIDVCRPLLPKVLVERWDEALCEALFLAVPKFYCPFKDCSAMMLADNEGENIRESECPFCHRLFCAKCNAPWHSGVDCDVFQKLNEDERG
ncbi:hypothetical protein Lal_00046949 [Lupinus albus]|uniref:RBR-type E3 ubiquitin transferase n=1 Tax=Lupinus albus TaxID=3870 RepID=A0A6A5N3C8_LUPAL|nr:putative transcription factor C2H2 family [Lupinus albus]KAF1878283.1 hypothetical protein Lal_00046949 [Lupinus albus]